mmetsp:Transcript_3227/g.7587  ORF Transcript_3227/g.7587 Transcript_3227/m.7587 type:complete len:203 (-) Transcript_3227:1096-1704(-)
MSSITDATASSFSRVASATRWPAALRGWLILLKVSMDSLTMAVRLCCDRSSTSLTAGHCVPASTRSTVTTTRSSSSASSTSHTFIPRSDLAFTATISSLLRSFPKASALCWTVQTLSFPGDARRSSSPHRPTLWTSTMPSTMSAITSRAMSPGVSDLLCSAIQCAPSSATFEGDSGACMAARGWCGFTRTRTTACRGRPPSK